MSLRRIALCVLCAAGLAALALAGLPLPGQPAMAQQIQEGRRLYLRDCAWCHGSFGEGTDRGPLLRGVGAASADFMLSTGRMPISSEIDNPQRRTPSYTRVEIDELAAFVASLAPGPPIPAVDPARGDLQRGALLYQQNCAACHSSTGIGGALTSGLRAPSILRSTPLEVAEAMRLGGAGLYSGNMPRFGPELFGQADLDAITTYIRSLQHPPERGGFSLGRLGPVAEGLAAWLLGLLALVVVIRWIGERA